MSSSQSLELRSQLKTQTAEHLHEEWHSFAGRVLHLNALGFPFLHGRLQHRGDHGGCCFEKVSMSGHKPISSFDCQVMRMLCCQRLYPQLCDALVDWHSRSSGPLARRNCDGFHNPDQKTLLNFPFWQMFPHLLLQCPHIWNGIVTLAIHSDMWYFWFLRPKPSWVPTSALLFNACPGMDQPFNGTECIGKGCSIFKCFVNTNHQKCSSIPRAAAPIESFQVQLLQILQRVAILQKSQEKLRLSLYHDS